MRPIRFVRFRLFDALDEFAKIVLETCQHSLVHSTGLVTNRVGFCVSVTDTFFGFVGNESGDILGNHEADMPEGKFLSPRVMECHSTSAVSTSVDALVKMGGGVLCPILHFGRENSKGKICQHHAFIGTDPLVVS